MWDHCPMGWIKAPLKRYRAAAVRERLLEAFHSLTGRGSIWPFYRAVTVRERFLAGRGSVWPFYGAVTVREPFLAGLPLPIGRTSMAAARIVGVIAAG